MDTKLEEMDKPHINRFIENYYKLILGAIFVIALTLRWWYLPQNAVSFAYDQARDAFLVQEILAGHLKVLGPPVSGVPGLSHGVLYYYIIAPAYFLGQGNPQFVAFWMSFLSSLGVFSIFYLAYILVKDKKPALLSALFFAVSFEATQYSNFLINASMGVWFVPLIYIGLYLWLTKSIKWAPILAGLAFGLSVQSEVALFYHIAPIVLWLFIFRKRIMRKEIIISVMAFVVGIATMIVSEIKFGFPGFKGALYLLSGQDSIISSKQLSDFLITFINQSSKTFAYSIFPTNVIVGGVVGFVLILYGLKKKFYWQSFLATYIFAYLVALPFGGWTVRHVLVGVAPAVCVLLGISLWKYLGNKKIFLALAVFVILLANVTKTFKENINGQTIFPLQGDLVLSKELQVLDYTYQKSAQDNFSISTLTSPLYVNTLWSYLYNWYGEAKYGKLPYWIGHDQIGSLGNNLASPPKTVTEHFFIIEPTYGIPDIWITYAKGDQAAISDPVESKSFGQIVVEERRIRGAK